MVKVLVLCLTFFTYCPQLMALELSSGRIDEIKEFKSQYIGGRTVRVWLPDGYPNNSKYSVLYMHDGQMLFDASTTWNKQEWGVDEVAGELQKHNKTKPFIVVAIDNAGPARHSEYYPQKPMESMSAKTQQDFYQIERSPGERLFNKKVYSDNYLKFLVEELKPYIDKHYAVLTDVKNTFIMGSSMGGLISMYAINEYPNIFGGAACLSTHWPGIGGQNNPAPETFYSYLNENLTTPNNHKFYFDYGNKTLDSQYAPLQKRVDEIMKSKGFTQKSWQTLFFEGHDHSERSWHKRLHVPLLFLLGINLRNQS